MAGDSRIGTELAGYRIESVLGRGGMSVVYLVEQSFPRRKVALKILAPELSSDPVFRDRFGQESEAAAALEHPNIIPIYSAGEADGVLYIAMRYIEGADLKALIVREGPLEPARAVSIITEVASALDAAHHRGLIHRDVKPGNVLVASGEGPEASDHAYLSDFGLIRRRDRESGITKTGQFMGTVDYVAPEQIEGRTVDHRADIYSLGAVLYECLAGEAPFHRDNEAALLYAHLNEPPPRPTAVRPELPKAIDDVVAKAMAKRPEDRFASAGELAAAVRRALPAEASPQPPSPVRARRRRAPLVALVVAVVAAIVALVVVLSNGGGKSPHAVRSTGTPTGSPPATGPPGPKANSIVAIDASTRKLVPRVASGFTPSRPGKDSLSGFGLAMAVGEGSVWAYGEPNVVQIDARTGARRAIIPAGDTVGFAEGSAVAVGFRAVWVLADSGVREIDPATGGPIGFVKLAAPQSFAGQPNDLAVGEGAVWVITNDGHLVRIDPTTLRHTTAAIGGTPSAIAVGAGGLWVLDKLNGTLTRFDPRTEKPGTPLGLNGGLDLIAIGGGSVWVLDRPAGLVTPIDPTSLKPGQPVRVGGSPTGITAGAGAVWVSDRDGSVYRVSFDTHALSTTSVGAPLGDLVVDPGRGRIWAIVTG